MENNNNRNNNKGGFNRGGYNRDNNRDNRGENKSGGFKKPDNRYNNNRGDYKPGGFKKPDNRYSNNRGDYKSDGFKKPDNRYSNDRGDYKSDGFKKPDNRYNNNRGDYKSGGFKKPDNRYSNDRGDYKSDGFKKNDYKKPDNRYDNNRGDYKSDGFKRNDYKKPDNRYNNNRGERKFDRDNRFEKKFDRKPTSFNKTDNSVNKRTFTEDNINITAIAGVEDEKSGMVYGRNAVIELLKSDKTIDKLYVQSGQREGSITKIVAEAIKKSVPIIEADKPKLDAMINNSAHQGVIALASEKDYCSIEDILAIAEERGEKPFILIADKIMDPHNLGAIIRTAECAGVHGLIIPKRNAAGVSPIVTKTSAGASVHMAIAKVANIATALEELKEKGVWIFASTVEDMTETGGNTINYHEADFNLAAAVVVGNESEGLAPIIIKNSDFLVRIPMFGKLDSLNVSCATAVILYEAAKQRANKMS